jgi:prolyl 4-hydroxylase
MQQGHRMHEQINTIDDSALEDTAFESWLREAVGCGHLHLEAMAYAMQADGYEPHQAEMLAALGMLRYQKTPLRQALESSRMQQAAWALIRHFAPARHAHLLQRHPVQAHGPLAPQLAGGEASRTLSDGREIHTRLTCASPELALFDGLLSADECRGLIELAQGHLSTSPVIGDDGDVVDLEARSSSSTYFEPGRTALVDTIEARIAELTGWPVSHMEEMSITRYQPGERFLPHWDYFDAPDMQNHRHAVDQAGQRVATVVLYLSDVPRGGATSFDIAGIELLPCRGSALYFSYRLPDGSMDEASLHGGTPVHEGEKWIATLWLRERAYRTALP